MRVLVTGATSPHGQAVVRELAARGHHVRAFGVAWDDERFEGVENVKVFPGWVEVGGSLEPVLSERQALVDVACMDPPLKGRRAKRRTAIHYERGAFYTRLAAEREQVDHFVHVTPARPDRVFAQVIASAREHVEATLGDINVRVVEAGDDPAATAVELADLLEGLPMLGAITGGHDNAVTA